VSVSVALFFFHFVDFEIHLVLIFDEIFPFVIILVTSWEVFAVLKVLDLW